MAGGFLLTETLATFTISAFVLLGLVSASSVLLQSVDRTVARVQDVDDLSRTMDAIRRDISGLMRARWNGDEPQEYVFRGGSNSLFFAHAQRRQDGSADVNVIALREIVAGHDTRLMRGTASLSPQARSFDDLHFGPQLELGTGPARLRFYYASADVGKRRTVDQRAWTDAKRLPAAILVEAVEPASGRLLVSTRIPIHADADIGCLDDDAAGGAPQAPSAPNAAGAIVGDALPQPPAAPSGQERAGPDGKRFCSREDVDGRKSDPANAGAAREANVAPQGAAP